MELSSNPMAIMNYQNDPEVMKVLLKIQVRVGGGLRPIGRQGARSVFAGLFRARGGGRFPGMPLAPPFLALPRH